MHTHLCKSIASCMFFIQRNLSTQTCMTAYGQKFISYGFIHITYNQKPLLIVQLLL